MKKLLVLLFLFCSDQILSQNRIGIMGGGIYAKSNLTDQYQRKVLYQSQTNFGNIISWFAGFVYNVKVTNEFSVKSKLLYMKKGWTETTEYKIYQSTFSTGLNIPSEFIKTKETYKVDYLNLPVYFTFYKPVFGKGLLSFGVGPYLGLGLSGKYHLKPLYSRKSIDSYVTRVTPIYNEFGKEIGSTQLLVRSILDTTNYVSGAYEKIGIKKSGKKKGLYNVYQYEYGASFETSLELRIGLVLSASYFFSVTDVLESHYGAIQNRNRVLSVGLGYYLKRK